MEGPHLASVEGGRHSAEEIHTGRPTDMWSSRCLRQVTRLEVESPMEASSSGLRPMGLCSDGLGSAVTEAAWEEGRRSGAAVVAGQSGADLEGDAVGVAWMRKGEDPSGEGKLVVYLSIPGPRRRRHRRGQRGWRWRR
jgi:hypothetical protein